MTSCLSILFLIGLFGEILVAADGAGLLSDEHFTVDGALIRAWASHKSLVPRDGSDAPPKSVAMRPSC